MRPINKSNGHDDECIICHMPINQDPGPCCYTNYIVTSEGLELWQDGKHVACCKNHIEGIETPLVRFPVR